MPEYTKLLNFEFKIYLERKFYLIAPVWFSFMTVWCQMSKWKVHTWVCEPICIVGKLFLSCGIRTVFEVAEGIWDSKTSNLNCSYEAFVQKEALTICQDRVFASFLCLLSLASLLGRFIHLYCDTSSLRRKTPAWEIQSSSSRTFPIYFL